MPEESINKLIEMIAKALVDKPDSVEVTEVEGEQTTIIELRSPKRILEKSLASRAGLRELFAQSFPPHLQRYASLRC